MFAFSITKTQGSELVVKLLKCYMVSFDKGSRNSSLRGLICAIRLETIKAVRVLC